MEVWLDLLRKHSPHEKIGTVFSMSQFALRMAERGVRAQHQGASDREVFLRVAARHLSRELMIAAYHWDPREHE